MLNPIRKRTRWIEILLALIFVTVVGLVFAWLAWWGVLIVWIAFCVLIAVLAWYVNTRIHP